MEKGQNFGDMGVSGKKTQGNTVLTTSICDFLILTDKDYKDVLKNTLDKNLEK